MAFEDGKSYRVLRNTEGQYSLWPQEKPSPEGWEATGVEGEKAACLAYVDATWTDMRPLSLQRAMGARV